MPDEVKRDGFEMDQTTGEVRLWFKGILYTLPPPDFGQLREIATLLAGLEADENAENAAYSKAENAAEKAGVKGSPPKPIDQQARIGHRIEIMCKVASALGASLPEPDRCSPWIGQGTFPAMLDAHWMLHPFLALGLSGSQGPKTEDE